MENFTRPFKVLFLFLLLHFASETFAMHAFSADGNPEIDILGNGVSISSADTTPSVSDFTHFGSVSIESGSTTVTYTIQNTGDAELSIGAMNISGVNAADFSIVPPSLLTIPAGGSSTFTVSFNPTSTGTKFAVISIVNSDADESEYAFSIAGLGVRTYADTDQDGVSDNMDIDDDNDGIPDIEEQMNCYQSTYSNLVEYTFLNETFGAGTTKGLININIPGATCTYCYEDGIAGINTTECPKQSTRILDDGEYVVTHKIAGTAANDPENIHGDLAWNGSEDHTPNDTFGRMAVFNANLTPGIFYETTIHGIIPNIPITYGFWAMNIMSQSTFPNSILPNITVEFLDLQDTLISSFNTQDIGRCGNPTSNNDCLLSQWQQYTTSVNLGNNSSFKIRFKNNAPGGGGNDLALDDITIKQQYCDRDNDGIANIFDLDSDNDGISDVEEAGFGSLSAGKSHLLPSLNLWADANQNGLHDSIDALITAGTFSVPDSDQDSTADFQDLDSDNDAQFDVDEAGLLNGDGDINGDGLGDGLDSDRDGLLDLFDDFTGFGTHNKNSAQDYDGDSIPDYLQIDSDSDGIFDIGTSLYANLDANLDGLIDAGPDLDRDGINDTFDTNTSQLGSPRDIDQKLHLDFDGRNDFAASQNVLGNLPSATIMGWIKLSNGYSSDGFLFGQDNFNLEISASGILKTTANSVSISFPEVLLADRWYHVSAVYDAANPTEKLILYVNGRQEMASNDGSLSSGLQNSAVPFTIGKNPVADAQYFKGSFDEIRIFNAALSSDQLQKMVYQEITSNGSEIRGEFIPKNIELSNWSSLLACYRMDVYKDDVLDNLATSLPDSGNATNLMRIYNVKSIQRQLAPMPFKTAQNGALHTSVAQQNFVNGNDVFTYPWSIVHIAHNINLNSNLSNLGLKIESNAIVNASNDIKIDNSWYLKLDGKIDLKGKSQLVQRQYSDLDPDGIGFIERDQQGTTNKFNYNYWCSPVGAMGSGNNLEHTVSAILRDGTNPEDPQILNWTSAISPATTSPVTLSAYWVFKFQNLTNSYSNWVTLGQNGSLEAGNGFTLKGSSANAESQNYVFTGKPNNATISIPIAKSNLNLAGNPFPSALDGYKFIADNLSKITGTLFFWEHYPTNNTHITQQYQGGYATLTQVGGTPPVAPPGVSEEGSSIRIPGRFIPVGQGFFVSGSALGGNITFDNSQRAFIKEDHAASAPIFRLAESQENPEQGPANNSEDVFEQDSYAKIRLGYDFTNGFHRQLLVGYMEEKANGNYNPGFDGINFDNNPDDLVFKKGNYKLVILGEGYFNANLIHPLEVKSAQAGQVRFTLDDIENFPETQPIFIFDAETGFYHDLRTAPFEVNILAGTNANRFSLRFAAEESLNVGQHELENGIILANDKSQIGIQNNLSEVIITDAILFNTLGQQLARFETASQDQQNIKLDVSGFATGTYFVQLKTSSGSVTKKIIL